MMGTESDSDTNSNWCTGYNNQRISIGIEEVRNKKTSGNHPNNSIVEIGQNTEDSPGDLKRLVVTRTPVENNQLTFV